MQIVEATVTLPARTDTPLPLPPRLLAALAVNHGALARFDQVAEPRPGERSARRVYRSETHDIWLIRWGAGSRTPLHDHGGSAGAVYVADGELVEHSPNPADPSRRLRRTLRELDDRPMPPEHIHEIANESDTVAASVHVYSPPLETMYHFELADESHLRMIRREEVDPSYE